MPGFDFKKEYKDLYMPKNVPSLIKVPPITFIAVDGIGNPNQEGGEYQQAMALLYGLSFTIKMSKMGDSTPEGYFEYVVPPLEGLWWMADGTAGVDYNNKAGFQWISMIRQPEFVTQSVFDWACSQVREKKGLDTSKARLMTYNEGLCVQIMHRGSYDDEPASVERIEAFINENGYKNDISILRHHHEIYLSDPRRCAPEKLRTIIRVPVR